MDFVENIPNIHIGSIIKGVFAEKTITKTEFANRINRSRTDVNDIFKRKSIDTELLVEISKVLEYDFIRKVYYEEYASPTIYIAFKIKEGEIKDLQNEFIRLFTILNKN